MNIDALSANSVPTLRTEIQMRPYSWRGNCEATSVSDTYSGFVLACSIHAIMLMAIVSSTFMYPDVASWKVRAELGKSDSSDVLVRVWSMNVMHLTLDRWVRDFLLFLVVCKLSFILFGFVTWM